MSNASTPDPAQAEKPWAGSGMRLILAIAWLAATLLVSALIWMDGPAPEDADLIIPLPRPMPNDANNAYSLLVSAKEKEKLHPDDGIPGFTEKILNAIYYDWKGMDLEAAKELRALNNDAWNTFQTAWAKSKFYANGVVFHDEKVTYPLAYNRLVRLQANILHREGKSEEAFRLKIEALNNLKRISEAQKETTIIEYIVRLSALSGIQYYIIENLEHLTSAEQAKTILKLLEELEILFGASRYKIVLKTEYMSWKQLIEDEKRAGELPNILVIKPNRTNALLAERTRAVINKLPEGSDWEAVDFSSIPPYQPTGLLPQSVCEWEIWKSAKCRFLNMHGESTLMRNPPISPEWAWNSILPMEKSVNRLARTAVALRLYSLEHNGQLPSTLETLCPKYLPEVPKDPWKPGKPLGYDATQGVLWSVGDRPHKDGIPPKGSHWRMNLSWSKVLKQRKEDVTNGRE